MLYKPTELFPLVEVSCSCLNSWLLYLALRLFESPTCFVNPRTLNITFIDMLVPRNMFSTNVNSRLNGSLRSHPHSGREVSSCRRDEGGTDNGNPSVATVLSGLESDIDILPTGTPVSSTWQTRTTRVQPANKAPFASRPWPKRYANRLLYQNH